MYFNLPHEGASLAAAYSLVRQTLTESSQTTSRSEAETVTVLTSLDYPVNKRFLIDDEGHLSKKAYQDAFKFRAERIPVSGIDDLAACIERYSATAQHILIRGAPLQDDGRPVLRRKENFQEPVEGCCWAMLDFDDVALPDGMDPLAGEALTWIVEKLPVAFHNVSYFYQYSASAGMLNEWGQPLKQGFNAHLFFWFETPIQGKKLTAWLGKHCMDTGFYEIGENRGGVVMLTYGIDPAPIRSEVQPHFIAAPTIEPGVRCLVAPNARQGLIRKRQDSVALPAIEDDIVRLNDRQRKHLVDAYKLEHGYVTRVLQTQVGGRMATSRYSVSPAGHSVRGGRAFAEGCLSNDGNILTLYFEDEGSRGSWFVAKVQPQIGRRHGDGASLPLRELSLGAHEYVRDVLGWFSEIPHDNCDLVEGFLPAVDSFAAAKVSLILAPTGSGKTTAAVEWTRSQIAAQRMVFYAAPTIALVRQMGDSLRAAGMEPSYYGDTWGLNFPQSGVVVTTNNSLPRLLKETYDLGKAHVLILDEIHQALDFYMKKPTSLAWLEGALSKARQSLLLTGTVTDVQRQAIAEIAKQALGGINAENYCCYEFAPEKRNPLSILPTKYFDSELVLLFEEFCRKKAAGEAIPRFVMLLDVSKMEMYRILLEQYGLTEVAMVVSRPECTPQEIEAARVSRLPILISSPLFGLGLNFEQEPEILWARFDKVPADTSQIIQAVNRANRGSQQCSVRIFGNVDADADFDVPAGDKLKDEVAERLQEEATLSGVLESHFQLDRITYNLLREAERNSATALSVLVRHDAIQNFTIVTDEAQPEVDKDAEKVIKAARKDGRNTYRQAIAERAAAQRCDTLLGVVRLERLYAEQRMNWKAAEQRVQRDFDNEESGIVMSMLDLADPVAAERVSIRRLLCLLGEELPWLSGQYDRNSFAKWGRVAAEKTEKLIVLVEKLWALREGRVSIEDLSASLTRNTQLRDAFLALVRGEEEFVALSRKFDRIKTKREAVRQSGGDNARAKLAEEGLEFLAELLEPLSVVYGKREQRGRMVKDVTQPIVSRKLNFPEMLLTLRRQVVRLKALPAGQTVSMIQPMYSPEDCPGHVPMMPRQVCEQCVFFDQNACALGQVVDWQSTSVESASARCDSYKHIKPELVLN